MSSDPSSRPTLNQIQESLLAIRTSITSSTPSLTQQQSSPQPRTPPLNPPSTPPQLAALEPCSHLRNALTRQRINASQFPNPARRQWLQGLQQPVSQQAVVTQASTPQSIDSQVDQISADWRGVTKQEREKDTGLRSIAAAAEAAAAPVTSAALEQNTVFTQQDKWAKSACDEGVRQPCMQKVWRQIGFGCGATSVIEENDGVSQLRATTDRGIAEKAVRAGRKRRTAPWALRVKKILRVKDTH